jgi:WD40 repeat protein
MANSPLRYVARRAVGWYPPAWRERYAEEVLDVLDQHRISLRTVADLMVNAAAARVDPAYRTGRVRRLTVSAVAACAVLYGLFVLATHEPTDFGVTGAHDVAYSADSRLVLTDGGDQALRLWNLADPAHPVELCLFRGGDFATLAPNGRTVATIDDAVVLWDVSDPAHPAKAAVLLGKGAEAEAAVFSGDGRILATGYHDTVILFDVTDPAHPVRLTALPEKPKPLPPQTFMGIAFSADGRTLASVSGDSNVVTLWDITDRAHPAARGVLPSSTDARMAFTPGGTLAVTDNGQVHLWDVTDPAHPMPTSTVDTTDTAGGRMGFTDNALELVVGPDGHTLITVMNNIKASAWDITDPSRPRHLNDVVRTDAGPGIFKISPDGRSVVSADHPQHDRIAVWNIAASQTPVM